MSNNRTPMTLTISAAIASASLAAGSLFSMDALAHGYQQDASKAKSAATEGKCGEGKCGAAMMAGNAAKAAPATPMHTFEGLDSDKDGRISRTEFAAAHGGKDDKFAGIDGNHDGFISKQEFDAHHAAMQKGMAEGKCGGDAKAAGAGADGKAAGSEGKCGEGKCGEGKCGGSM
ncbi:MAG TPA: EF-hand domain-containing protein [Thermomonas sp.]|jgi:uncharacterized low-complexity protein|nr:EF-hand domain-containing protein [Thermomonas sp.]HQY49483.1 EF-hand domain-containing protein [Thermomonas sp.]HRA56337.1 EF-hand domain-containing protein [Thermomonas sp.]